MSKKPVTMPRPRKEHLTPTFRQRADMNQLERSFAEGREKFGYAFRIGRNYEIIPTRLQGGGDGPQA